MGRLLTKATWGILPRAAFAFSDECCNAIVRLARLVSRRRGRCDCGWSADGAADAIAVVATDVKAAAGGAVTAPMGDLCGCVCWRG